MIPGGSKNMTTAYKSGKKQSKFTTSKVESMHGVKQYMYWNEGTH